MSSATSPAPLGEFSWSSISWLIVAVMVVLPYVWKPDWPHVVRQLPLWPWLAPFAMFAAATAMWTSVRQTVMSVFVGALLIGCYLYVEFLAQGFVFELERGRLATRFFGEPDYLVGALVNVLWHVSVVAGFAVSQMLLMLIGRMRTS